MLASALPYLRLMRLDRPIGTLLLLWPTLAALWLAARGLPPLTLVVVFSIGTLLMRSAGCVINDFADRDWDRHVQRTAARPLTTGAISTRSALGLFAVLSILSLALLVFLNTPTRWLALGGFLIAVLYPFTKRWTHLPQVVLGAAFSWGLLMAFTSFHDSLPGAAWLLFAGSVLWIVAYDTEYAMVDRDDDLRVGIRSTAILFGRSDRTMIAALQIGSIVLFTLFGQAWGCGAGYWAGLIAMALFFVWQQVLIRERDRDACLKAFLNNAWAGLAFFLGVLVDAHLVFSGTLYGTTPPALP
ncbi:MAG: 4-hydroxybenzoate octaprenyltransferase [Pseudomonadales bacterium]